MSADTDHPLIARGLHKTYPASPTPVSALRGVDLTLSQGEMIAIMGASGSGKSTLLHLLSGLSQPDTGTVTIAGSNLAEMGDQAATLFRRQQLGIVFQAFNLVPTLDARTNVALPALLDGNDERTALSQADAHLAAVGLAERAQQRPDQLSGGEQQRVAIARALINQPAVLLADEPTGNLDSHTTIAICELLASVVREQGRSLILVTHEPSVAIHADRVVVLADGVIVDDIQRESVSSHAELAARYHALGTAATGSEA